MLNGFSFIRNGNKYDYPFIESFKSLADLCDTVYLAIGDSDDGTEKTIEDNFPDFITVNTKWDDKLRTGGYILSEQTNVALKLLRDNQKTGWAFYLQGDEVLHESDFEKIKEDLSKADKGGYDAISFRYFHFWLRYNKIAIRKNWYPQEIRAIKVDSNVVSYGDAQSFKNQTKVYQSDAFIYHYGHVRDEAKYKKKMHDFHKLWHPDEDIKKIEDKAAKKDNKQPILHFLGGHPKYIKRKVEDQLGPSAERDELYIILGGQTLSDKFINSIFVKKVKLVANRKELPDVPSNIVIDLTDNFTNKLLSMCSIPRKMKSKNAREWNIETIAKLKLSKKGFWIK